MPPGWLLMMAPHDDATAPLAQWTSVKGTGDSEQPIYNINFPSEKTCNDYQTVCTAYVCVGSGAVIEDQASSTGGPGCASVCGSIENAGVALRSGRRAASEGGGKLGQAALGLNVRFRRHGRVLSDHASAGHRPQPSFADAQPAGGAYEGASRRELPHNGESCARVEMRRPLERATRGSGMTSVVHARRCDSDMRSRMTVAAASIAKTRLKRIDKDSKSKTRRLDGKSRFAMHIGSFSPLDKAKQRI